MPRRAGRHFLQIPGPTNVPDRVLRAIDSATIDHRGPEFGAVTRRYIHKYNFEALERLMADVSVATFTSADEDLAQRYSKDKDERRPNRRRRS